MFCPKCGSEITEGKKFCANCGTSVGGAVQGTAPAGNTQQSAPMQPARPTPGANAAGNAAPKKKKKVWLIILIIAGSILTLSIIAVLVVMHFVKKAADDYLDSREDLLEDYEEYYDDSYDPDFDLDSLNEAVDDLNNLDLDTDLNLEEEADLSENAESSQSNGDFTKYSYADVTVNGMDITVVPNGGLNGSTKLFQNNNKDLDGFLDYVDDVVLEEGRMINRDLFYEMLACMLVDKDLLSDKDSIERNMIMALAMANNFYNMKVIINECDLDGNNADIYRYKVTAFDDADDIWVVNYNESTVFFNDGKTEYHSDMFKNDYLAVWMVAIEEYYGLN